jgi:hypothetical protein
MNMIDVMQRLAELDAGNPNIIKENDAQMSGMSLTSTHATEENVAPAMQNSYNFTTSIFNPAYDAWEKGAGDENNPPPETIEVGINYSTSSDSDESGRFSEISQYSIHDLATGEELNITNKNVLSDVEDDIRKDAESSKDDDYDIPDKGDYYENADEELAELRRALGNKTPVSECGMMPGMAMAEPSRPSTPASINMTAASGPELSGMLRDIMQLAGMNNAPPATMSASPQILEPVSAMSAADSMRGVIDRMNPADDMGQGFNDNGDDGVNQAHGDLDNDGDHDMDDHDMEKKQPVDEYDNTPADPNDTNEFDANQYANQENQPGQGDRMDGDRPKAYADMNETVSDLFAQYKKFVNESTDMQAEDAVDDFKAKGGKVQQLAARPPRKSEKTNFGSKHIGGRRDAVAGKAGKTLGRAATTNFKGNSKPVVGK